MKKRPKLDIAMLTYNHEKYIQQALDSILSQKVNFDYRIIIADDASTDKTPEILIEYQRKYKDRLCLILNKENIGIDRNVIKLLSRCRGKYIAYLEGDDYWIDENKLQRQYDFLEQNKNYIGVAHNCIIVDEKSEEYKTRPNSAFPIKKEHDIELKEMKNTLVGQVATVMHRNFFLKMNKKDLKEYFKYNHICGDVRLSYYLITHGKIHFMEDFSSAYRYVYKSGDSYSARTYSKNMCLERYLETFYKETIVKKNLGKKFDLFDIRKQLLCDSSILVNNSMNIKNIVIYYALLILLKIEEMVRRKEYE